jgi:2-keto-4-pentenoate hydratase/2-oxohepta-3-ene-1,7-dioic acid hydratase in catechol pathway
MKQINYQDIMITPSKVVCVGRNYVAHIHELNNEIPENMVLFNKPNSAISDTLSYFSPTTRFEAEICFLVEHGRLSGIGFGLDLTHAHIQNRLKEKGLPWERAKSFNASAVLGKFIPLQGDIQSIQMKLFVNDTLIQHATYDLMIYKPEMILKEIESFMHLEDGDIIMTGTPKGVSTYKKGDIFVGKIFIDGKMCIEESFIVA